MNLFEDGQSLMADVEDHLQLKEMTKNPNTITMLEERVNEWIKKVMEVFINFVHIYNIFFSVFSAFFTLLLLLL